MPRTLLHGCTRSIPRSFDRVSRVILRAQRMPSRRRQVSSAHGPAEPRGRARARAGLAVIGLVVVIVIVAAIATTFAIAGITLSFAVPVPHFAVAILSAGRPL